MEGDVEVDEGFGEVRVVLEAEGDGFRVEELSLGQGLVGNARFEEK